MFLVEGFFFSFHSSGDEAALSWRRCLRKTHRCQATSDNSIPNLENNCLTANLLTAPSLFCTRPCQVVVLGTEADLQHSFVLWPKITGVLVGDLFFLLQKI